MHLISSNFDLSKTFIHDPWNRNICRPQIKHCYEYIDWIVTFTQTVVENIYGVTAVMIFFLLHLPTTVCMPIPNQ